MNKERGSSIFYRSFWEAIKELPKENQLELYDAIFSFIFEDNSPSLKGISRTVFTLIKPQLEANQRKFDNGKKGGRPKKEETKRKPNINQKETKRDGNVNENENVNENYNVKDVPNYTTQYSGKTNFFLQEGDQFPECLLNHVQLGGLFKKEIIDREAKAFMEYYRYGQEFESEKHLENTWILWMEKVDPISGEVRKPKFFK